MNFKRVKPFIFPVLIVSVFIFAILGFRADLGEKFNFWGVLFTIFNYFIMNDADPVEVSGNPFLLIAKYLAAVLVGYGLFSLSFRFLRRLFFSYRIRFSFSDHIIIFSLDPIAKSIAEQLLSAGYKVVIVENDEENPSIEEVEEMGGIIITASPFEKKTLDMIGLSKARICILAHTEDITNIQIADKISSYAYQFHLNEDRRGHDVLKIFMHIDEFENIDVIKDYFDINNADEHYDLHAFSINQLAAQKVYDAYAPHQYFTPQSGEECSIAIIGCNKTTEFFLLENIILSHYAGKKSLKIYLVDKDVETFYHDFHYQYPFCDEYVELIPVKLLNANFFANFAWSKLHIEKLAEVNAAYFFGESDSVVVSTAAAFRQFIYSQTLAISQTPLIITLPEDSGIYNFLNENDMHKDEVENMFKTSLNMHYVRRQSDTFSGKSLIEESEMTDSLSRVINFYYSVSYEFGYLLKEEFKVADASNLIAELVSFIEHYPLQHTVVTETALENDFITFLSVKTGIDKQALQRHCTIKKRWNLLNNRKKDSNRYAARNLSVKQFMMQQIGCWPVNREQILKFYPALASIEHKRWSAEKMVFNFKYGPFPADKKERTVLKEVLKIHDQLIPYDKLTEEEKGKDLNLFLLMPLLFALKQHSKL
ncbi:NAD-binding protein [Sediminibacterium goheungense]|uniref:TrkA family protein n=1 Tax=Sediminibacterium goheungense TaxID=1086393 RepID=A0A4R6IT43_9BACT|nr:NAD-binding protein [Sediminibacterium goheungense]TDO25684.1 TrkA family protein [Sediminibacterium goheungense]